MESILGDWAEKGRGEARNCAGIFDPSQIAIERSLREATDLNGYAAWHVPARRNRIFSVVNQTNRSDYFLVFNEGLEGVRIVWMPTR